MEVFISCLSRGNIKSLRLNPEAGRVTLALPSDSDCLCCNQWGTWIDATQSRRLPDQGVISCRDFLVFSNTLFSLPSLGSRGDILIVMFHYLFRQHCSFLCIRLRKEICKVTSSARTSGVRGGRPPPPTVVQALLRSSALLRTLRSDVAGSALGSAGRLEARAGERSARCSWMTTFTESCILVLGALGLPRLWAQDFLTCQRTDKQTTLMVTPEQ